MNTSIPLAVLLISLIPLFLGLSVFEITFGLILTTPILAFLLALKIGMSSSTYLLSFFILSFGLLILNYAKIKKINLDKKHLIENFIPIFVFILSFYFIKHFILKWPDFVSIGERLRDFALLSSVIQSPIELKEPWLAGFSLNYYAFWYRFGHMLSSVFGLKTYEVYHLLQTFTFALYFTTGFVLFNKFFDLNKKYAVVFSFLICFGSNFAGIKDYFFEEPGWWGPSRVIPGAINEFPAWSFILGDLHPHYLNLPLLPFLLIFFTYTLKQSKKLFEYLLILLASVSIGWLWIENSNVWDRPVWLLLIALILSFYALQLARYYFLNKKKLEEIDISFKLDYLIYLIFIIALSISLYISKKHIVTPDYPINRVGGEIARTTLHDFCLHFGIPLLIIFASTVFRLQNYSLRIFTVLTAAYFFFSKEVILLLVLLISANTYLFLSKHKIFELKNKDLVQVPIKELIIEVIGVFSLCVILVPEIIFLNDPYGSDVERMNTIFKLYSVAWFFIHAYAFYYLAQYINQVFSLAKNVNSKSMALIYKSAFITSLILAIFLQTGFFFVTVDERTMKNQTIKPYNQGLSEISRLFPGSDRIIKSLLELPKGVVLEAQGKPYDYTSFVSTLSENEAYLGWANHVNLLLSNNPEIGRRERFTETFYNEFDCNKKKEFLQKENIKYIVYGKLEKDRYKNSTAENFSCFEQISENLEYKLFRN